jgi:hypothetical protein
MPYHRHQIAKTGRIEMNLSYLGAWEIQPQRHPSDEKLNPPSGAGDRKKGVLVNTPTFTWVCTRAIQTLLKI